MVIGDGKVVAMATNEGVANFGVEDIAEGRMALSACGAEQGQRGSKGSGDSAL
jgi:hypothetical protein